MNQPGEINEGNGDTITAEMLPPAFLAALEKRFRIGAIKNQQVDDMPGEELFHMPSDADDDDDDHEHDNGVDIDMEAAWGRIDLEIGEEGEECREIFEMEIHDEVSSLMRKRINVCISQKEVLKDLEEFRKRISFPPLSVLKEKSFQYLRNPEAIPEEYQENEAESETEGDTTEETNPSNENIPDADAAADPILPISISLAKLPRSSPRIHNNNLGEGSPPPVEMEAVPKSPDNPSSTSSSAFLALPDKAPEPQNVQNQLETEATSQIQPITPAKRKHSEKAGGTSLNKVIIVPSVEIINGGIDSKDHRDTIPITQSGDNAKERAIQVKISSTPVKASFKVPEVPTSSQSPKPNIYVPTPPTIVLPMRRISADLNESTLPMNSDPLSDPTMEEPPMSNGKLDQNSVLECQFCREHFSPYEDNLFRKHLLLQHDFEIEKDKYFDKKRIPSTTIPLVKPLKHGCGICGNVFSARYELKRHIEASHDNFISKIILYPGFRCAQCLKGFNSSFELTNHCLVCSDKYPYPDTIRELAKNFLNCDLCGVTHQNTHEASKCYFSKSILRCALCFDIFKMKDNFYKHLHSYHGLQFHAYPKFTLPCPFCRGCYACWGKYQEIFPHIVADHYQQSLDAMGPPSSRGGGGNNVANGNGGSNTISIYHQHQHGEPGMPIVMSVVGNYAPTR